MKNEIKDKILGSYIGLAVGDALGATTEFMTPREIQVNIGVHNKITGGGWLRLEAGSCNGRYRDEPCARCKYNRQRRL